MDRLAKRLRLRARELGLTDAEVARRSGLTERRYGHYVTGIREPNLSTLLLICRVLATTPDGLLLPEEERSNRPRAEKLRLRMQAATNLLQERELELAVEQVELVTSYAQGKPERSRAK